MDNATPKLNQETLASLQGTLASITKHPNSGIAPDTMLHEMLGLDSMAMIQALIAIEEEFDIVMPGLDVLANKRVVTVKDLVRVIDEQRLESANA